jgi:hypothetical protein
MVDLMASAERCRLKARQCELLAKDTSSAPFANATLLLFSTADLEEDFVRRDLATNQHRNSRREVKVSASERRSDCKTI